jgi:hypothetical protein
MNIVLTVSTTCFWSEVRIFCWALAVETFAKQIRAKVTANAIGSCDDVMRPPGSRSNKYVRFYLFPDVKFLESTTSAEQRSGDRLHNLYVSANTFAFECKAARVGPAGCLSSSTVVFRSRSSCFPCGDARRKLESDLNSSHESPSVSLQRVGRCRRRGSSCCRSSPGARWKRPRYEDYLFHRPSAGRLPPTSHLVSFWRSRPDGHRSWLGHE